MMYCGTRVAGTKQWQKRGDGSYFQHSTDTAWRSPSLQSTKAKLISETSKRIVIFSYPERQQEKPIVSVEMQRRPLHFPPPSNLSIELNAWNKRIAPKMLLIQNQLKLSIKAKLPTIQFSKLQNKVNDEEIVLWILTCPCPASSNTKQFHVRAKAKPKEFHTL